MVSLFYENGECGINVLLIIKDMICFLVVNYIAPEDSTTGTSM
jgi:hypothetical protein